jgi:protein Tex
LVHISHLSDTFVKDPRDAVKTGDMVKVKVLEVDIERKRISLTMKTNTDAVESRPGRNSQKQANKPKQPAPVQGSMASAFAKALKK